MDANEQPYDEHPGRPSLLKTDLLWNAAIDAIVLVALGFVASKYGPLLMQQGVAENIGAAFYLAAGERVYSTMKLIRNRAQK